MRSLKKVLCTALSLAMCLNLTMAPAATELGSIAGVSVSDGLNESEDAKQGGSKVSEGDKSQTTGASELKNTDITVQLGDETGTEDTEEIYDRNGDNTDDSHSDSDNKDNAADAKSDDGDNSSSSGSAAAGEGTLSNNTTNLISDKDAETITIGKTKEAIGYTEAFNETVLRNNHYINVMADAGVFPDDSQLFVKAVTKKSRLESVKDAVLCQLESEGTDTSEVNVDVSIFDISVKYDGEEVQPDTSKGDVTVSITKKEAATPSEYDAETNEEQRLFHVVEDEEDDSEVSLEEVESEISEELDGVSFNAEHFSEYVVATISDTANESAAEINISSSEMDENGDIEWTVLFNRSNIPVTEYTDGFGIYAEILNWKDDNTLTHTYVDGSFTAMVRDGNAASGWSTQEYTDFKLEDLTAAQGQSSEELTRRNYMLSWRFVNNTKDAVVKFTFKTHVNTANKLLDNNTAGDVKLGTVYMDPVKVTNSDGTHTVAGTNSSRTVTVEDMKPWIAGEAVYDTANEAVAVTLTVHSNSYNIRSLDISQTWLKDFKDDFYAPSDFSYYYDGNNITADIAKYADKLPAPDSQGAFTFTLKEFEEGNDHTFKLSYLMKLKNPDEWKKSAHNELMVRIGTYFWHVKTTEGDIGRLGPSVDLPVNFGSTKGAAISAAVDKSYGKNGYDASTHTIKWKITVNGLYSNITDYVYNYFYFDKSELCNYGDFKYTNSKGEVIARSENPNWMSYLTDSEKEALGIDKNKEAYMVRFNGLPNKAVEYTVVTKLTNAYDYLWAANADSSDLATVLMKVGNADWGKITESEPVSSEIISINSVNKKGKSGYNYNDHTIDYEVEYNQNMMELTDTAVNMDMGQLQNSLTTLSAPVTELKEGSEVKLDGVKLTGYETFKGDAYRPCYVYNRESGLTVYPKDETIENSKVHKITFTAKAIDNGSMFTDAGLNDMNGSVIVMTAKIKSGQTASALSQEKAVNYAYDTIKLCAIKIAGTVNGTVQDNGNVAYEVQLNKNGLDIPDGLKLKLELSSGHKYRTGSMVLYEASVSEDGSTVTKGAEVDSSKYTVNCTVNADSSSVLTVSLPADSGSKFYIADFTADTDLENFKDGQNATVRVKCTASYEGNDSWSKISSSTENDIKLWTVNPPEGSTDAYWLNIKAVDADDSSIGIADSGFVIEDESGSRMAVTGVNVDPSENNTLFKTPASGAAIVYAKLDASKKYYVRQISAADGYFADDNKCELELKAGYTGQYFVKGYSFNQTKASELKITQALSFPDGISNTEAESLAKGISYEVIDAKNNVVDTVSFADLTYNSETGKYESKSIKVKAGGNAIFKLAPKNYDLAGYNYKVSLVGQDSAGSLDEDDFRDGDRCFIQFAKNGSKANVDFTNSYEYALELRVYPAGNVKPDENALLSSVSVDVKNETDKKSETFALKDFAWSADRTYLYKKVPAAKGQYTITELTDGDAVSGYTVQTEHSIGTGSYISGAEVSKVNVANGRITETSSLVSFKNTYTSASDKLSLTAAKVTSDSVKLKGGATKAVTEVYYTKDNTYAGYTPVQLRDQYNEDKKIPYSSGTISKYTLDEASESFTIELEGLSSAANYTYYAAAVCKDGTMLGDGQGLAKASFATPGKAPKAIDFAVTGLEQKYTGDDAEHRATVKPMELSDDGSSGKYFDIDKVQYKAKNAETGEYTGSFTDYVSQAGVYGVFVTTGNEKEGTAHAENTYAADLTIGKADLDKSWYQADAARTYGNDSDIAKLNKKISKYGELNVILYTDAALTKEAAKNAYGHYNAGSYYLGVSCTGGDNVNKTAKPLEIGTFTINKGEYDISLGTTVVEQYGAIDPYVLSFLTDNGVTEEEMDKYDYVFSKDLDGVYSGEIAAPGDYYVKVKVFEDENHVETLSAAKIVRFNGVKLKVKIDSVKGKTWDGTTDIKDGDFKISLERADSSVMYDDLWEADLKKGLSVSGKAAWTSADAGTDTFNISNLKLVAAKSEANEILPWYELTADHLDKQTYRDAKISGIELTKADFTVSGTEGLQYVNNITAHTANVAKTGSHASDFEIDHVSYKLYDAVAKTYSDETYSEPIHAGTYGIFVTTKDEKNGIVGAENLYLADMTIDKASFDESWVSLEDSVYRYEPTEDKDFAAVDNVISGYGSVDVRLYTDAKHTIEAKRNSDNQYDAGTYYAVIDIKEGKNLHGRIITNRQLIIHKADNNVQLDRTRTLCYGDDMTNAVSYVALDDSEGVEYLFSRTNNAGDVFKAWDDTDTNPTGIWYVKVYVPGSNNYEEAVSAARAFELKKAPLVPVISNLKKHVYDGTTDASKDGGKLSLARKDGSAAAYGKLDADLKAGLSATGTFAWTDPRVGTDTVNVTGITIDAAFENRYELTTDHLDNQSFNDAMIYAEVSGVAVISRDDLSVSEERSFTYSGEESTANAVSVTATGVNAAKITNIEVSYKLLDADGNAGGDYIDNPTQAGRYEVYVSAESTDSALIAVNHLRLTDSNNEPVVMTIAASDLKKDWFDTADMTAGYGTDSFSGITKLNTRIAKYGLLSYRLYTDDALTKEAQTDAAGHYPAGTYYVGVSVTGGTNVNASAAPIPTRKLTVAQAQNIVTVNSVKDVYYGDDMSSAADITAKYGADTVKLVFARTSDGEFAAWDEENTEPSGMWYVKAKAEGTESYTEAESKPVAFRVKKAPLMPVISGLDSKKYDGNTSVTGGAIGLMKVSGSQASYGKLDADIAAGLSAAGTFAWTDAAAGTSTVNVTDIKLNEAYSGRYELAADYLNGAAYGDARITDANEPAPKPEPELKPTPESDNESGKSSTRNSSRMTGAVTGKWMQDAKGWWYEFANGDYVKGSFTAGSNGVGTELIKWYTVNGKSYAFGADGYLRTGWIYDESDGKWYYCDENNGRQTGWHQDESDGYRYYLDPKTGAMLTGWQLIDGKWYFLSGEASYPTWSYDADSNRWVYNNIHNLHPFGSMLAGTVTPDNFRVDLDGVWEK